MHAGWRATKCLRGFAVRARFCYNLSGRTGRVGPPPGRMRAPVRRRAEGGVSAAAGGCPAEPVVRAWMGGQATWRMSPQ